MMGMNPRVVVAAVVVAGLAMAGQAVGQKDTEEEPAAVLSFLVLKEDNGKPVRNAAVIMHAVNAQGKQGKGDLELKTNAEGRASFDGIPYGELRVQVLAHGFQTYGEDFDINKPNVDITIKLKLPQHQYSAYEDHPRDSSPPPKQDAPPPDQNKKPN
jgi:5-hydroxyisourate hydrolase-like protein (transthyretin family)